MTEWKQIDTAPKDGTKILLYVYEDTEPKMGTHEYEVGRWLEVGTYGESGWFYADDEYQFKKPTHWTPLPEPPKKEHYCKSSCGDWVCKTNKNTGKGLVLADYRGVWTEVVACPFCGEKASERI